MIRVLCLLTLATLFGACRHDTPTQPPASTDCCHAVINVAVQDTNGHGISGAAVSLNGTTTDGATVARGPETTTDGGATAFRELCPGRYELHAVKDGYVTTSKVVELTCNDTVRTEMVLHSSAATTTTSDCHSGRITLVVTDSATHAALTGGSASLYHNGHLISTKELGSSAVWDGLETGAYSFSITHDGYTSFETTIDTLTCNEQRTVNRTMSATAHDCCSGVVELTATDAGTGHALSGTVVTITQNGVTHTATSTDNGAVRFGDLCEGGYRIVTHHDGYVDSVIEFTESCNATHGYNVALNAVHTDNCCTAVMSLHVEDSIHNDSNIQGATVTIRIDGNHDTFRTGTTTDGGNYTTDGVCGHTNYIVTITKDGYNSQTFSMPFTDCHTYSWTVLLGHH